MGASSSQNVFGRSIHHLFPVAPNIQIFNSDDVNRVWRNTWEKQEYALRLRLAKQADRLQAHSRRLNPLESRARVRVQNQTVPHAKRWHRSGMIVDAKPNDQYIVKVNGSVRVTLRNQQQFCQVESLRGTDLPPTVPQTRSHTLFPLRDSADSSPPALTNAASTPPAFSNATSTPTGPYRAPQSMPPIDRGTSDASTRADPQTSQQSADDHQHYRSAPAAGDTPGTVRPHGTVDHQLTYAVTSPISEFIYINLGGVE